MKFCAENAKDIDKYFRGSYMKFPSLAGDAVHFIDKVTPDQVMGKTLQDGESVPFVFHLYHEESAPAPEIEFILPKKSYFNTPTGACLLYRIPARQYRKGVCMDNTAIVKLAIDGSFAPQDISFDLLNLYVGKQAFAKFGEQSMSYAVSRRMAVSPAGQLFLDKTRIGSINYDNRTIMVNQQMFVPEVEQVVRANKQSFTVAVKGDSAKKAVRKVTNKYGIDEDGEVVSLMEGNE